MVTTGLIIGLVITIQTRPTLIEFGTEAWLPGMISVSLVREIVSVITTLRNNVTRTVVNIRSLTDSLAIVSGNLQSLSDDLKNGKGIVRVLFTDSDYIRKLDSILVHLQNGSGGFDESMTNLKRRWPFKAKKKRHS